MIEEMRGWKVIVNGTRFSGGLGWRTQAKNHSILVKYPVNVEVFQKLQGSKLFFFQFRKEAQDFAERNYSRIVVPCVAYRCRKVKRVSLYLYDAQRFWRMKNKKKKCNDTQAAPKGSWAADSIKCLA